MIQNDTSITGLLAYLEIHEIDYRIESNFCCGYIFYFLDGSIYPRRYMDGVLEGKDDSIDAESTDHLIQKALSYELRRDWLHRIEAATITQLVDAAWQHLAECSGPQKSP